jgi:zinc transport system substrate-binding protein
MRAFRCALPLLFLVLLTSAKVGVCVPPLKYLVRNVAGEETEVVVAVEEGRSPAEVGYPPSVVRELTGVEVFFYLPMPSCVRLAKDLSHLHPEVRLVDLSSGLEKRRMVSGYKKDKEGRVVLLREKKGTDPHMWTSPSKDVAMAKVICETLSSLHPEKADEYRSNLKEFTEKMEKLKERWERLAKPLKNRYFVVYHPCLGYFADELHLTQLPLQVEGKELRTRDLYYLLKLAKEKGVNLVVITPPFSERLAKRVARILGARLVKVNHLSPDFVGELERLLLEMRSAEGLKEDEGIATGGSG